MKLQAQQHEIICATDLDHTSLAAESVAYKMAGVLGCKLRLVHVIQTFDTIRFYLSYIGKYIHPAIWEAFAGEVMKEKARSLRHRIHIIGAAADANVTFDIFVGKPEQELLSLIENSKNKIKMIVLSKRKRSFFKEFFLGPVANSVIESQKNIAILVIPDKKEIFLNWQPELITVASTAEADSSFIIDVGTKLAHMFKVGLEFINVLYNSEIEHLIEKMKNSPSTLLVTEHTKGPTEKHDLTDAMTGTLIRMSGFPLLLIPPTKTSQNKEAV